MSVRGIFASHSSLVGDRRDGDFAGRVLMNQFGGTAPMLALSAGMPKTKVSNTSYSWVEDSHISGNAAATGTINDSATTLAVDDTNIWVPFSIIQHQASGEQLYITAISGLNVTVIRGFAGTTPSAITAGDKMQLIGTAFGEGTAGAQPVAQVGESFTNYVQIFKQAWSITGTAKAIEYRTGPKAAQNKAQAMMYLTESIERAFMFGRPSQSHQTVGARTVAVRTSGGIQHALDSYGGNVVSAAANSVAGRLNLTILNQFIVDLFDRNIKGFPNERICYTSSYVLNLIQQMVQDIGEYTIKSQETMFGIKVTRIETFNGSLTVLTHPMFVENPSTWNRQLWALHPAGISRRVLRDLQTLDISGENQADALDATEGHLLMEMGFEVQGVRTMGYIDNIQTAGGVAALASA